MPKGIKKHGTEIVIVDPLYRGLSGLDTNKLADIGGAIVEFSKACEPASLILSHHITKAAAREFGPPKLEDLSGRDSLSRAVIGGCSAGMNPINSTKSTICQLSTVDVMSSQGSFESSLKKKIGLLTLRREPT